MRRTFFLMAIPCLLAMPFLTAGKANAQVSLEIEGHASFALDELSSLADGTGVGGLVAITYPIQNADMLSLVGKIGFNHYGSKAGDVFTETGSLIPIDSPYQGIPITVGARLYYGEQRPFYVEGLVGLEIKRGDLDQDTEIESLTPHPVLSIGAGYAVSRRLALIASLGMSKDLWRYGNLGVSYRFRK
ncbi:MAG: hypothetical protein OXH02_11155 [Gemmatimonadetes bacterium]|nr:hypothetical protein [Gemmatimonadota bacterium]